MTKAQIGLSTERKVLNTLPHHGRAYSLLSSSAPLRPPREVFFPVATPAFQRRQTALKIHHFAQKASLAALKSRPPVPRPRKPSKIPHFQPFLTSFPCPEGRAPTPRVKSSYYLSEELLDQSEELFSQSEVHLTLKPLGGFPEHFYRFSGGQLCINTAPTPTQYRLNTEARFQFAVLSGY
jgi:hypothetical protein